MNDKQKKIEREEKIIALVSQFCKEQIDEEHERLCIELTKKLGRKRNVPFMTGNLEIWAASIVHVIGTINFLFDKTSEPYIPLNNIHEYFGTKNSTVNSKSKMIRDLLKIDFFNTEFVSRRIAEANPLNSLVMVDGFIVPIESLPEKYQQMVREARALGKDISFSTK